MQFVDWSSISFESAMRDGGDGPGCFGGLWSRNEDNYEDGVEDD
jgi:hypothetical protein